MRISVIIPAYNAADTLAETLDSVAHQTRQADEIIVVDDGSTDTTAAIALAHPLTPKVISTVNQGAAAALNLGISEAGGDVLAFIDADDLWHESKLELQTGLLRNEPDVGMVFSGMEAFLCPSVSPEVAKRLVFPEGSHTGYITGTLMLRRDIFTRHGLFDPGLRTGYFIDWFCRLKAEEIEFRVLQKVLLKRRVRQGTLGQRKSVAGDGLSADFIEIARRSILSKRKSSPGNS